MRDLAPDIHRQRLVIEGRPNAPISDSDIRDYLSKMSENIGMLVLQDPITHHSSRYGWAGWIHWETSGAHFYAWETPQLFFSADIYACKAFSVEAAVALTLEFFGIEDVEYKEF